VVVLRAAAVDAAAVTQTEWATALAKLTKEYGPGQVCIPGVSTAAAYAALLAHAARQHHPRGVPRLRVLGRVRRPPWPPPPGLAAANGAERAGMFSAWATVPAAGGTTRDVPGSVLAAGLAARGDSFAGHTNNAPIFDQGRGAGVVRRATAVTTTYSDTEADTLYDAGVNTFRVVNGVVALTGWRSLGDDTTFRQLNVGRLAMQLVAGLGDVMNQFLGRQIDGRGHLFAEVEGAIRGLLLDLYNRDGLYGETPDDAFDVDCSKTNNPDTSVDDGQLHAGAVISATPHTEQITIDVVTAVAEGVAA
jgi:hypothetical protein